MNLQKVFSMWFENSIEAMQWLISDFQCTRLLVTL